MSTIVSLEETTVVVNGHTIEGWSDDADALMMPDIELADGVWGADGLFVASGTGNRGGEVVFKLMANSPSTRFFERQVARIMRDAKVVWEGTIRNSRLGTSTRLERGILKTASAGQTLGKGAAAARQFTIMFGIVLPNYDGANFDSIPAFNGGAGPGPISRI